jgi:hypothetical protein
MSKDKYLHMCELMGDEPDLDKIPPDFYDFPWYIRYAFDIFNYLPDKYMGGGMSAPIYAGKDITALPVLFEAYQVDNPVDKLKIIKSINILDARARSKAIKEANKASKKK